MSSIKSYISVKTIPDEAFSTSDNVHHEGSITIVVPPDSSYGWIVVFASFMCNVIVDGIVFSSGLIQEALSNEFKISKAEVGLVSSLLSGFYLLAGPFVSALVNKFGFRITTITGAVVGSVGFFLSSLVDNIFLLYLTYGVIGGIGFCFIYIPSVLVVGYYFEKWRALATGVSLCGSGMGTFIFAPLTTSLVQSYGWRGTMAIQAGGRGNRGSDQEVKDMFLRIALFIKELQSANEEHLSKEDLFFLNLTKDQFRNFESKSPRYATETLYLALSLRSKSTAAYEDVRKKQLLRLLHKAHLDKIVSSLRVRPHISQENLNYFMHMIETLTPIQRIVNVSFDEVYMSAKVELNNGTIYGFSENKPGEVAKTCLSFYMNSVFGNFGEMFRNVPVSNLNGDELVKYLDDVIEDVQNLGFEVLVVSSDNHRINRKVFAEKSHVSGSSLWFENPKLKNKKIFMLYDSKHIKRNWRNNWLRGESAKNREAPVLHFPNFGEFDFCVHTANFDDIRKVYLEDVQNFDEAGSVIHGAYKLNSTALWPSGFDRQREKHVDVIFNDRLIGVLKAKGFHDTASFCEIGRNWNHLMNSKHKYDGIALRHPLKEPYRGADDPKIKMLLDFVGWLDIWRYTQLAAEDVEVQMHPFFERRLTNDTFEATRQTTLGMAELVKYVFTAYKNVEYLLSSKLQTSYEEMRFGVWRAENGNNYLLQYKDIINAETRVRIKHILNNIGDFRVFQKMVGEDSLAECVYENVEEEMDVFDTDSLEFLDEAETMTAGAAARSVASKISCSDCKEMLIVPDSKGQPFDSTFLDHMQRGGLIHPTTFVKDIYISIRRTFNRIMRDKDLFQMFLDAKKQTDFLIGLTKTTIGEQDSYCSNSQCMRVKASIIDGLLGYLSNTFLNGYSKCMNIEVAVAKSSKRKTKIYENANAPGVKRRKAQNDIADALSNKARSQNKFKKKPTIVKKRLQKRIKKSPKKTIPLPRKKTQKVKQCNVNNTTHNVDLSTSLHNLSIECVELCSDTVERTDKEAVEEYVGAPATWCSATIDRIDIEAKEEEDHVTFEAIILLCCLFGAFYRPLAPIEINKTQMESFLEGDAYNINNKNDVKRYAYSVPASAYSTWLKHQQLVYPKATDVFASNRKTKDAIELIDLKTNADPNSSTKDKSNYHERNRRYTMTEKTLRQPTRDNAPFSRYDIFFTGSLNRIPQYVSQTSLRYHLSVTSTINDQVSNENKIKSALNKLLQFSLLKSPSFLLLASSGFFTMTGLFVPFIYITARATNIGDNRLKDLAVSLVPAIGISNTIARVLCGLFSSSNRIDALLLNNIFVTLGGIATILSGFVLNPIGQFVYAVVFGFSIACFSTLRSIIVVELMGLENLTNAFGLLMMFQGIAAVIGGPMAGLLMDLTNSYDSTFYAAGILITISAFLCYPLKYVKTKENKKTSS